MDFSPRWIKVLVAISIASIATSISARDLKNGSYSIRDRGQLREFEIALNEIQSTEKAEKIPGLRTAEEVRQHADALSKTSGREMELVLHERGVPRTQFTRRILTKRILAELHPQTDPQLLAKQLNLRLTKKFGRDLYLFETTETGGALEAAELLRDQPGVISAEPQLAKQMQKRLVPNDIYFPQQWHLRNFGQNGGTTGIDINVLQAWDNYRGEGIIIGILDDGLQLTHPDLVANVNTTIDWDFNGNDADPSPALGHDWHGTCVAGVAAARGNNSLGVAGAAYNATLVGFRLVSDPSTDEMEYSAMLHSNSVIQIKNNSWGPSDGIGILEGPGTLTRIALQEGTTTGRDGKGTIFVWAAGNGGDADNANYDGYANSIYAFAIGAVADNGTRPDYSERGACLVVSAPSSSSFRQEITTTDLMGFSGYNYDGVSGDMSDRSYTKTFTGTSASAPLACGVIALVLQANPQLGYRDVKEILMRSATKISPFDSDWRTNAAGIQFNHKFGAGLINAGNAISLATNWSNLGIAQQVYFSQTGLGLVIPDNNATGITRTFTVTNENFRVEHVTLAVTAPHQYFGNLEITLTSPSGTQSTLADKHSSSGSGYNNWKFSTVRNWGEKANGTWTVKIADLAATKVGTLNDLHLGIHGTIPEARLSIAQTGNNRELTLRASAPEWSYALETSTNLVDWSELDVFQMPHNGISTIVETNAPPHQQFYRAVLMH